MSEWEQTKEARDWWARYEAGARYIRKVFHHMCEIKPDSKSPLLPAWEEEMKHAREHAVQIGEIGHKYCIRMQAERRKSRQGR